MTNSLLQLMRQQKNRKRLVIDTVDSFLPVSSVSNFAGDSFCETVVSVTSNATAQSSVGCSERSGGTDRSICQTEEGRRVAWLRLVLRTDVVRKALQCEQMLIHCESQSERLNEEGSLRATNSTWKETQRERSVNFELY